jgi:hypothetical protein
LCGGGEHGEEHGAHAVRVVNAGQRSGLARRSSVRAQQPQSPRR